MVTLDFSKCKTPEDVKKAFKEAEPVFEAINKPIKEFLKEEPNEEDVT